MGELTKVRVKFDVRLSEDKQQAILTGQFKDDDTGVSGALPIRLPRAPSGDISGAVSALRVLAKWVEDQLHESDKLQAQLQKGAA